MLVKLTLKLGAESLTQGGSRLKLLPNFLGPQDLLVVARSTVPRILFIHRPVHLRRAIVVVPADLVHLSHVWMNREYWCLGRGLDADVLIATCMPWVPVPCQHLIMGRILSTQLGDSCKSIYKKVLSTRSVGVGQKMEQLKSCRICEISVVGVSAQGLVGVCRVLEGQVCGEVPEST